jgi:pantothenate synthetase
VNLATHELAKRFVDELMPSQRALTGELRRNHARGVMRVVFGLNEHVRSGEA